MQWLVRHSVAVRVCAKLAVHHLPRLVLAARPPRKERTVHGLRKPRRTPKRRAEHTKGGCQACNEGGYKALALASRGQRGQPATHTHLVLDDLLVVHLVDLRRSNQNTAARGHTPDPSTSRGTLAQRHSGSSRLYMQSTQSRTRCWRSMQPRGNSRSGGSAGSRPTGKRRWWGWSAAASTQSAWTRGSSGHGGGGG